MKELTVEEREDDSGCLTGSVLDDFKLSELTKSLPLRCCLFASIQNFPTVLRWIARPTIQPTLSAPPDVWSTGM